MYFPEEEELGEERGGAKNQFLSKTPPESPA
jgi:hypothetical protein